jgi:hypothetical protein
MEHKESDLKQKLTGFPKSCLLRLLCPLLVMKIKSMVFENAGLSSISLSLSLFFCFFFGTKV